jgi:hypothetical protein
MSQNPKCGQVRRMCKVMRHRQAMRSLLQRQFSIHELFYSDRFVKSGRQILPGSLTAVSVSERLKFTSPPPQFMLVPVRHFSMLLFAAGLA